MSGFLQRIAAGAARPERNLHPQVGAMFEAVRREEIADKSTPLEGLTLANGAELAAKESLTDQRHGDLPGDKPQIEPARLQEPNVELLIPQYQREGRVPERDPTDHVLVGREARLRDRENRKKVESSREDATRPQVLSEKSAPSEETKQEAAGTEKISDTEPLVLQRLLVREMAQKDASAGNVGAADPEPRAQRDAFPRLAKGQNQERTQSPQRVESAMQDIEIHIGRIEVIAVPPPAPRVAAASPRRTMSLDDYLKQRNGRAR
jgi:hypothetical protein